MRRAALIVNPKAGRSSFEEVRDDLLRVLARHGFEAEVSTTTAEPNSAQNLALEASRLCDLVIACGGDGTVHGALQGVAGSSAALGVLPFGTANALARNLLLPLLPVLALERLLGMRPKSIPLGRAETVQGKRWFTVMAGAGPDGRLIHEMRSVAKARDGRRAYYSKAARLFLTRRFPAFQVEYRVAGAAEWKKQLAVGMMASRIADLGGLFTGLTTASRLHHPHLVVQLLRSPAHLAFPAWMALGKLGCGDSNPWLTTLQVEEIRCTPLDPGIPVYAQIDAEAVGPIPLSVSIVPEALRLLMPEE